MRELRSQDTLYAAPEDGAVGATGPSIFFAGTWGDSINYAFTSDLRPYVRHRVADDADYLYYLRKGSIEDCVNVNPYEDVTGSNIYWSYTDKQDLILATKIAADQIETEDLTVKRLQTDTGNVKIDNDTLESTNGTFTHLRLKGSTQIDYATSNDLSTITIRNATRIKLRNQGNSQYFGQISEQGVNTNADMEGRELEIFLTPSIFTRSSIATVLTFEDGIIDYSESGTTSFTIYRQVSIGNDRVDAMVAGGYIRLIFSNGYWEAVSKTGNIILS